MSTQDRRVILEVDHRERASGIFSRIENHEVLEPVLAHLTIGDYRLAGELVIERKTVDDFAASLVDGRLLGQCARLRTGAKRALLIIEGPEMTDTAYDVHPQALRGALYSISTWWQIPVIHTLDLAGTIEYLTMTARQSRVHAGVVLARMGRRPKRLSTRQLHVLQGLPGVGREIAGRLLLRFGSVRGVFAASAGELVEVEGIGAKRAEAIVRVLDAGAASVGRSSCESDPQLHAVTGTDPSEIRG